MPASPGLCQNYPNPFNARTRIRYQLPEADRAEVAIFDLTGRRVARLVDELLAGGEHPTSWDGTSDDGASAASGVYFCRLRTSSSQLSVKLVLIR